MRCEHEKKKYAPILSVYETPLSSTSAVSLSSLQCFRLSHPSRTTHSLSLSGISASVCVCVCVYAHKTRCACTPARQRNGVEDEQRQGEGLTIERERERRRHGVKQGAEERDRGVGDYQNGRARNLLSTSYSTATAAYSYDTIPPLRSTDTPPRAETARRIAARS